ncbi:single-stranded DNA-binding protein [Microvirga sp. 17 mud 1-3]|uniref:single-stranded DNA-binding protein n=1 Tax=Microvirga sp. 17 mud 1-3 TaxID=2082949 RepID=UPI001AECB2EE|nr:single-stranded DNA-binding protein [Microvirga sp. 17 mud 1-3]
MARLGRDAEVRYTPDGDAVCNLSLAVSYGQKGQDGNRPTQWIDASLWGKRAESLAQYLVKGSLHCFTLDEIHIETFQGKNGQGHKLAARVIDVELGPRAGGDVGTSAQQQQPRPAAPAAAPASNMADMDDDIPF